jgi:hypothetical protein
MGDFDPYLCAFWKAGSFEPDPGDAQAGDGCWSVGIALVVGSPGSDGAIADGQVAGF